MLEIASSAQLQGKIDYLPLNTASAQFRIANCVCQYVRTVSGITSNALHIFQVSQPEHSYLKGRLKQPDPTAYLLGELRLLIKALLV